jgi:hypothetical protein
MENETKKETTEEQVIENNEEQEQPSKAIILFEDNGEVKFLLQGISMDEAFIMITKGYTKLERTYKASI